MKLDALLLGRGPRRRHRYLGGAPPQVLGESEDGLCVAGARGQCSKCYVQDARHDPCLDWHNAKARSHLQRGDLTDGLIFDAVRIRLLENGEAVKALPGDLMATQPSIPWRQITRMHDHLASNATQRVLDRVATWMKSAAQLQLVSVR